MASHMTRLYQACFEQIPQSNQHIWNFLTIPLVLPTHPYKDDKYWCVWGMRKRAQNSCYVSDMEAYNIVWCGSLVIGAFWTNNSYCIVICAESINMSPFDYWLATMFCVWFLEWWYRNRQDSSFLEHIHCVWHGCFIIDPSRTDVDHKMICMDFIITSPFDCWDELMQCVIWK